MVDDVNDHTFTLGTIKHLLLLFREGMIEQAENKLGTVGAIQFSKGMDQYLNSFVSYLEAIASDVMKDEK